MKNLKMGVFTLFLSGIFISNFTTLPAEAANAAVSVQVVSQNSFYHLLSYAKKQKGIKYVDAGTSTKGFDASGYIYHVFGKHNVTLPRTTKEMF